MKKTLYLTVLIAILSICLTGCGSKVSSRKRDKVSQSVETFIEDSKYSDINVLNIKTDNTDQGKPEIYTVLDVSGKELGYDYTDFMKDVAEHFYDGIEEESFGKKFINIIINYDDGLKHDCVVYSDNEVTFRAYKNDEVIEFNYNGEASTYHTIKLKDLTCFFTKIDDDLLDEINNKLIERFTKDYDINDDKFNVSVNENNGWKFEINIGLYVKDNYIDADEYYQFIQDCLESADDIKEEYNINITAVICSMETPNVQARWETGDGKTGDMYVLKSGKWNTFSMEIEGIYNYIKYTLYFVPEEKSDESKEKSSEEPIDDLDEAFKELDEALDELDKVLADLN